MAEATKGMTEELGNVDVSSWL